MLNRKMSDLDELGMWLKTEDCVIWFNLLGSCTGMGSRKMLEVFMRVYDDSVKFIEEYEERQTVDKKTIDNKKNKI